MHEKSVISPNKLRLAGILGLTGAVGATFFFAIFVSLHWLDPSVDISRNFISDYANGDYSRLFRVSTILHGVGNLAIAGGLALVINSRAGRRASALFGLASIAIVIAGIFSTDPEGAPRTASGNIHLAASILVFLLEGLAMVIFVHSLRHLFFWRVFTRATIVVLTISAISFLWLLFSVSFGRDPGLPERASFLAFMAWEILTGLYLAIYARVRMKTQR